ncbi:MAG: rRNA maturation RNase YbeY [Anaerolineaceae bacterium]|nr:rRNA maturation RNase YbeY [Anaerolineaceae bacterium]
MGIYLDIPQKFQSSIDSLALRKNIQLLLIEMEILDSTDFTIAFVDDPAIQALNLDFRGIDSPTDVLSFPSEESNPEDDSVYIGDIVISMDTVERQSVEDNVAPIDEIHLLIIHGLLHLLGYDHDTVNNKKVMWEYQARLLQLLHCPANPDQYYL